MKNVLIFLLLLLTTAVFPKTMVIPIDKEIEDGLVTFIKRAIKDAEAQKPDLLVFEINTFGGRVDAALEIVELISSVKCRTLAYVKEKAISAGALIALSCNDLVMQENTTLGDCAPIMMGEKGPEMMGEKFQSPLRAKFRSLAKKNNYPIKLSEAMVSTDREIVEVTYSDGTTATLTGVEYTDLTDAEKKRVAKKRTVVAKGELLTMSAHEAEVLGFSRKTVKTLDEAVGFLRPGEKEITRLDKKRSENLLIWFNKIAPLLILIGLAGIYMEIKTPGFGLFGIIGIAAFLIFFSTKYIVGLADHVEVLLFILGLAFLVVEIFVLPGFGIFGVLGIGLILASVLLAMQSFVLPSPKIPWQAVEFKRNLLQVGVLFALSVPLFILAIFSASRLVMGTALGHHESEASSQGFTPADDYSALLGKTGHALSPLRPAGAADINGRRYDVVSDGDFINTGEPVKVTDIAGNRIMVKKEV
ncbi:MAG: NfeD family protein [Fibrobacterota bacterium]